MKRGKCHWLSHSLLVLLLLLVAAGGPVEARDARSEPDFAAIDGYVEAQLRAMRIPGAALALVQGDRIVHTRGFGSAGPDGRPVTPQTPFILGSASKPFTALAVLQLVEANRIALDEPVQRYLPWFRVATPPGWSDASAQITVRQLLMHRSGLPEPALMEELGRDGDLTLEERVRQLDEVTLVESPGTTFLYASANYLVLAVLVQAVAGEPFEEYVRTNILRPVGMAHTYLSLDEVGGEPVATGYRYWFGVPRPANLPYPRDLVPAAYFISTADDLARFLIPQINAGCTGDGTAILSPAGVATMQQGAMNVCGYGMGWWTGPYNSWPGAAPAIYHGGATANFRSYVAILPEGRWGMVLLLNANSSLFRFDLDSIATGITDLLTGRPLHPQRPTLIVKYLLLDLGFVVVAALALWSLIRLIRGWTRPLRARGGRSWRAVLPLVWELGSGLFILLAPPHLGRLPWLARWLGENVNVTGVGNTPWSLLLNLVPDVAWWLLAMSGLLIITGSLRLVRLVLFVTASERGRPRGRRSHERPADRRVAPTQGAAPQSRSSRLW